MPPSRHRLGVAVLLVPPVADEVEGLRRAVGGVSPGRMAPHLTLVPPVNVRRDELGEALARLRAAAGGAAGPVHLTLGPTASFFPANAVVYLEVGGDLAALGRLHEALMAPPLQPRGERPWVPHVTVAHSLAEDRLTAALLALDRYAVVATIHRVTLLEEATIPGVGGRRWVPLADAALGPPAVVGRGGLALELTRSARLDPEAAAMVAGSAEPATRLGAGPQAAGACGAGGGGARGAIVLTARREGAVVGVAAAWRADDGAHLGVYVAPEARRQGVGTHLLAHLESAVREDGWSTPVLHAVGPAGFYRARSRWARPEGPLGLA